MPQLMQQSEATAAQRRVLVYLVDDTDGKTAETGVTISAGDVKISKNGAAEANHGGTWAEIATGTYYYEFTAAELDTLGFVAFKITKSGVRTFVTAAQVVSFDPYDSVRAGLTSLPNAAADAAGGIPISDAGGLDLDGMNTNVNDIETDTNELQTDWANGGRLDLLIDAVLADTAELQTDDIPGSLSTISGKIDTIDNFLDTEVAAILADTNELQGDWANGGRLDLIIDAVLADTNELQGDDIPGSLTTISGKIDTIDDFLDTEVAAILADTNELQGDWANGGRLDLLIDAILADTNELQTDDVPGTLATILADTNELQVAWTDDGRLDVILDAILVDTGTTLEAHLGDIKGTGFAKDTHSLTNVEGYVDLVDDGTSGLAKIASDVAGVVSGSSKVTPIDVDGLTYVTGMESIMSVLFGVATPSGSDVAFMLRDGSTTQVTVTYGATDGQRTVSAIT